MNIEMITKTLRSYLIKRYVKDHAGTVCLLCGSIEISDVGEPTKVTSERYKRPMRCFTCGAAWNDLFILQGVGDVDLNHAKEGRLNQALEAYKNYKWE